MSKILFSINKTLDSRNINFDLYDRITFVSGDSGVGKTFLFNQLQLLATSKEYKYIKGLNILTPDFAARVKEYAADKDALVVIDHGDILIDEEVRYAIVTGQASFLIFSRNYFGLAFTERSVGRFGKQFWDKINQYVLKNQFKPDINENLN